MSLKRMTSQELAHKVINGDRLFILDVRNTDEFDHWRIEGKGIEIINEPYFNLLEGVDHLAKSLPKDEPILTVCAKGGSSEFIGEQLVDAGFEQIYSLEGGMKAWSEHLEPVKIASFDHGGALYQFVRLGKGCLSYMLVSDGQAAVIDATRMIDVYQDFAKKRSLTIKYIFDTHLHADHISGGRALAEAIGASATYYLPPKDAEEVTYSYEPLVEGHNVVVGQSKINVQPIYSPGHTIGSTSFVIDDKYLLTGDILFVESIGRPDLAGKAEAWVADLRETLYNTYQQLSKELIVCPAHFSHMSEMDGTGAVKATLGELFKKNEGLQVHDEETFRKMVTENLPPQPNAYMDIRQVNMGKHKPNIEQQREMEMGPNRCAVHYKLRRME
ncbi:glyoxylase-like metal-dependent hydrolase (beta-lactamase superfamily II) [Pullulanibacillus pueri]|uniref:Hydroxyacylglutathione hydrolase n=1 Tax=Pullulanibacillus pueri TaxID=1437324 RepID=A0A8J3ELW3_9BACL|nr:MBL fold metallo-hydrolase [Pullulanibacillus pueri]MBM7681205.1 glyoxylase-like metal-dependent hydrolase (beta-lactamase superfamily II) [Pullulanibacillus pueri]GGH78047.1 hydroxyacylglutathione hydrolase [Pullulanibacillus pueri]